MHAVLWRRADLVSVKTCFRSLQITIDQIKMHDWKTDQINLSVWKSDPLLSSYIAADRFLKVALSLDRCLKHAIKLDRFFCGGIVLFVCRNDPVNRFLGTRRSWVASCFRSRRRLFFLYLRNKYSYGRSETPWHIWLKFGYQNHKIILRTMAPISPRDIWVKFQ